MSMRAYISIITVCYNSAINLKTTLCSVFRQMKYIDCSRLEYIIIDGNSSDESVEIAQNALLEMRRRGVQTSMVSESDNGIYDAMNKGLEIACGEWVYMLNAGDILYDAYVLRNVMTYAANSAADVLYGNAYRFNSVWGYLWVPAALHELRKTMILCHQALFIRKEILCGKKYNTGYSLVADYDLCLALYLSGITFEHMDLCIVYYSLDGLTANKMMVAAFREIYKVRKAQGMLGNPLFETVQYILGVIKRYLLKILPVTLRWRLSKLAYRRISKIERNM